MLSFTVAAAAVLLLAQAGASSNPPGWVCTGPQQVVSNWNTGGVTGGGTPATFSTGGAVWCIDSIATYHTSEGTGPGGGAIGISGVGTFAATATGATAGFYDWVATPPAGTLATGTFDCVDSAPASWAQNATSGGRGFCKIVYRATIEDPNPPRDVAVVALGDGAKLRGDVTLRAAAADDETGVERVEYELGDGTSWRNVGTGTSRDNDWAATFRTADVPDGDLQQLRAVAYDFSGRSTTSAPVLVNIDNRGPMIDVECNGAPCSGWYTETPVQVTADATDAHDVVFPVKYTTDGTDPVLAGGPFPSPLALGQTTTLRLAAQDDFGNWGARTIRIGIDTTPPPAPQVELGPGSSNAWVEPGTVWYGPVGGTAVLQVPAGDDPESGVASVDFPSSVAAPEWTVSNVGPLTATYTWTGGPTGGLAFPLQSTNGAGVTGGRLQLEFTLDDAAPDGSFRCVPLSCSNPTGPVSVTFVPDDAGSGAGAITHSTGATMPDAASEPGDTVVVTEPNTTVRFWVADRVGNSTVASMLVADAAPSSANARIWASLDFDYVLLTGFTPNSQVTIDINGAGAATDTTNEGGFAEFLNSELRTDLVPGMRIEATDAQGVTRSLTLASIHIASYAVGGGTVSGTAPSGPVGVFVYQYGASNPNVANAQVNADGDGNWNVDFGAPVLTGGRNLYADTADADGDVTRADVYIQTPHIAVSLTGKWVNLYGWTPGSNITLKVDGQPAGGGIADAFGTLFVGSPQNSALLVPGAVVQATSGIETASLTLALISVGGIDLASGIVQGGAPTGAQVRVNVFAGGGPPDSIVVTAGLGDTWVASFGHPYTRPVSADASIFDAEGDYTVASLFLTLPDVNGDLGNDELFFGNWPANTDVRYTVEAFQATVRTDARGQARVPRSVHGVDLVPGVAISATAGDVTKNLTLADVSVDAIDLGADTITGRGPPGTTLDVNVQRPPAGTPLGNLRATANVDGVWSVATAPLDLTAPLFVFARAADADNDGTSAGKSVSNPQVIASLTNDFVQLQNWTPGTPATLTIDGAPFTVAIAPNGFGFLDRSVHGRDLKAGDTITATQGTTTKTLSVVSVTLNPVVPGAQSVSGTAPPDSVVQVCLGNGAAFLGCRQVTIGPSEGPQSWLVDITGIDVTEGTRVSATVFDADLDGSEADFDIAPETTIDGSTSAYGGDGTQFTFRSADAAATFECSIDGAQFLPCASPKVAFVASGSHTFAVRATKNGNPDPTPAQQTFEASPGPPGATTLRVDVTAPGDVVLDTGVSTSLPSWQILNATCAKLVNYQDRAQPLTSQLVPEVAVAMPVVSSDGQVYTFRIRSGFAFANGDPVTAQSFKDALDRIRDPAFAAASDARASFSDITSVTADGDLLTISLSAPRYDLLARLAQPYACPVPAGTPHVQQPYQPGSGPYTIASADANRVVLQRNPRYRGDRPDAFDEIDFDLGVDAAAGEARVLAGVSDYLLGGPPPADNDTLAANYPQQFTVSPTTGTQLLTLTSNRPPFDSASLRRAVNYALDRKELSRLSAAGPLGGIPTDQILPPGTTGRQDWALYPLDGPDVAKALSYAELAGVTPTSRVTAQLYTTAGNPSRHAMALEIQTDLAAIGIDVVIREVPANQLFGTLLPNGTPDLALFAWLFGSVDPAEAIDIVRGGSPTNYSRFLDPGIDTRIATANATPPTGTRYDQFATLDRDVMAGFAPVAPISNTTSRDLFSARIAPGSRIVNPVLGIDIPALSTAKVVTNANDAGPGSLRQALLDANAQPGSDVVSFAIPGAGVHTITAATPLPELTDQVVVDGYTQPGADAASSTVRVELRGSGLVVRAEGSTIRGLSIGGGGTGVGIWIDAASARVTGNFLGVDTSGTVAQSPQFQDVVVSAPDARIDGNVISGAGSDGVFVGAGSDGAEIVDNVVGLDVNRAAAVPNAIGVRVSAASSVRIAGNTIAGNDDAGIVLEQGDGVQPVTGVAIDGNTIGLEDLGNGGDGVEVRPGVQGATVANNEIAWNSGNGVSVDSLLGADSFGIAISTNSIHDNDGKGIAMLSPASNRGIAPPALTSVSATQVSGSFVGGGFERYTVEVFLNETCEASGEGEGQELAGSLDTQASEIGAVTWTFTPASPIPAGSYVTATVRRSASGDTSEFALCLQTTPQIVNLEITADQLSVPVGAASFPLASLPAQLFQLLAGVPSPAPIPSAPIPSAAVGAAPIPSAPIPSAPIPSAPIPSAPIPSAPIPSAPIPSAPIPSAGLAGLPIPSAGVPNPLDAVLLTSLPGLDVVDLFAGTPLAGKLPQQYTLGDVYRTPAALAKLEAKYTVADLPLNRTLLRGVRTLSLLLGGKTLGQITLPNGATWCGALAAAGGSCTGVDLARTTVIGLDMMRQLGTLDETLGKLTVGSLAGGLEGTLIGEAYLARIALEQTTIARVPASAQTTTCAPACATLGDAARANAVRDGVRLKALGSALNDVSLNELVVAMLSRSAFPWEEQSFLGWQGFGGQAAAVQYHVDFDVRCPAASAQIAVLLPFGFLYQPGSSSVEIGFGAATALGDPAVNARTGATWTLPIANCPGGAVQHVRLNYRGLPGFRLGPSPSTVTVTTSSAVAKKTGAAVDVQRSPVWVPALDRSTEPTIEKDTIVLSHVGAPGATNYFRIPEVGRGRTVTVYLKPPAGTDLDLYVVRPAPSSLLASPIPSAPIPSAPIPSAPIPSAPIPSASTSVSTETDNPAPELLDDGPLPGGQVAVNSITRGDGLEAVSFRQAGTTGFDEIAVAGYNGDFSPQPFELRVVVEDPVPVPAQCPARTFGNGAPLKTGQLPVGQLPAAVENLALVNVGRMNAMYEPAKVSTMLQRLRDVFAANNGAVLEVDGDTDVYDAARAWDASPCSSDAANAYVRAVNAVVARYRGNLTALKSITIVGDDEQLAFARVPDFVPVTNEADNTGGLSYLTNGGTTGNATYNAAAEGYVLTDDAYGAFHTRTLFGHEFFLPEVALGRLVETPEEITTQLEEFVAMDGVLRPTTGFVTGYDFMADGAKAIGDGLAARLGPTKTPANALLDAAWGRSALEPFFMGTQAAAGINSWNGHYDASRLAPATYTGPGDLLTTSLLVTPTFRGSIFFTMGCHAGESIADTLTTDLERRLDWAQAYMRNGAAVFVGNTGYGYGDTGAVALSERLMAQFARHLGYAGPVGEMFMETKNEYFASMGAYGPYDEKSLAEATFYGLPFWRLNSPSEPVPAPPALDTTGPRPVARVTIEPALTQRADPRGSFWSGGAGTVFVPGHSVQPLETLDLTQPASTGLVAHGFFPSALVTEDRRDQNLYFAKPMIDLDGHEPEPVVTNETFPASPVKVAQVDYLGRRRSTLNVIAGQARPGSAPGLQDERLVLSLSGDVTYASADTTDFTPPRFIQAGAIAANGSATIFATVTDESAGGVLRVRAFYTTGGPWTFVDLDPVPGSPNAWRKSVPVNAAKIEAGFVAEDVAANTGWMTAKGDLLESVTPAAASASIVIDRPLDGTQYTVRQPVSARYACGSAGGIESCTGTAANGAPVDTASVGRKSFTVTAKPFAGTEKSKTVGYDVVYPFSGFPSGLIKANAGATVVVTFKLGGNFGLNVLAGQPRSGAIACTGGTVVGGDPASSPGNSGLKYDAATQSYQWNWKTEKSWTGCRQLVLTTNDGVAHRLNVQFTK